MFFTVRIKGWTAVVCTTKCSFCLKHHVLPLTSPAGGWWEASWGNDGSISSILSPFHNSWIFQSFVFVLLTLLFIRDHYRLITTCSVQRRPAGVQLRFYHFNVTSDTRYSATYRRWNQNPARQSRPRCDGKRLQRLCLLSDVVFQSKAWKGSGQWRCCWRRISWWEHALTATWGDLRRRTRVSIHDPELNNKPLVYL